MPADRPARSWLRRRLPFLAVVVLLIGGGLGLLGYLDSVGASAETRRTIHATFNWVEALVWGLAALAVFWMTRRSPAPVRRLGRLAAAAYLAFGASDIVEVRTGAWYDPWWLLAWKAACVAVLVGCLILYRRIERRSRAEEGAASRAGI